MMRADHEHASSGPTAPRHFESTITAPATVQPTWTFEIPPLPDMGLTFLPRPQPGPRKRSRAAADIDGEHSCTQKKKRRLRLFLITSRLSPQFSHPATNIVDRGSSKIAVWAKQKSTGRNLLRKAAILNGIRRRTVPAQAADVVDHGRVLINQEREQEELAMAKLEFNHGSVDTYTRPVTLQTPSVPPAAAVRSGGRFVVSGSPTTSPTSSRSPSPTPPSPPLKGITEASSSLYCSPNEAYALSLPRAQLPRRDYLPLPPSPLGLSNYAAFDLDEDIPNPYSHLDDEEDEPSTYLFNDNDDDDGDPDSVPFSPSAITSTSSSTLQTRASQVLKSPLQTPYSDFNILNHGEPVFGDYDGVDEGASAVWPSSFAKVGAAPTPGSTSPNFNALFATATSKRTDSFATSPNFRPTLTTTSETPGFQPNSRTASTSPNYATSPPNAPTSPNFTPNSLLTPSSPNFTTTEVPSSSLPAFAAPATSPNLVPVPISPNFLAIDGPSCYGDPPTQRRMSMPSNQQPNDRSRRNSDFEQERKRQRDLMFTNFGS